MKNEIRVYFHLRDRPPKYGDRFRAQISLSYASRHVRIEGGIPPLTSLRRFLSNAYRQAVIIRVFLDLFLPEFSRKTMRNKERQKLCNE